MGVFISQPLNEFFHRFVIFFSSQSFFNFAAESGYNCGPVETPEVGVQVNFIDDLYKGIENFQLVLQVMGGLGFTAV